MLDLSDNSSSAIHRASLCSTELFPARAPLNPTPGCEVTSLPPTYLHVPKCLHQGNDLELIQRGQVQDLFDFRRARETRRRQWQPTPVLLPGRSHGQRRLVGCSPWGHKELGTTEQLHFHALEKEMATHSSVLACRIPGTEEPSGLPSMGSNRIGHD